MSREYIRTVAFLWERVQLKVEKRCYHAGMLMGDDSDDEFYVPVCQLCLVGFDPCTSAISAMVPARLCRSDLNALVLSDTPERAHAPIRNF
jgi:hypothetical protein